MAVEYYEEYEVDAEYETASRTVTETDIVNFVNLFGFTEPLFINMEFVEKQSLFGGRIAPGAFTFSMSEGLMIQAGLARGGLALLGIEELKVPAPLRCGDTVHVKIKVLAKRETSKPDRGVVTFDQQVLNSKGDVLLHYTVKRMIRRRPAEYERNPSKDTVWKRARLIGCVSWLVKMEWWRMSGRCLPTSVMVTR